MRYLITATDAFDAGHSLPGAGFCEKPGHGHHWTVTVEVGGELGPRRKPSEERLTLLADLRKLVGEFEGRDLNLMLPAAAATPENVAIQFMERLRFGQPRMKSVTVTQDAYTSVTILDEEPP